MNLVAYNFGPVSSHQPNHSMGEVSNPCQLLDICPQNHSLEKHGDSQNDSVNVSKTYRAMGFIQSDGTTNIMPKTCFERANWVANNRINKVEQQLMDSASKEWFLNPEMLSTQLQNLIPLGTLHAHPLCEASSSLRTDSTPIWKTGGAQGLPDLYNLSSQYVSVGHMMNLGTGYNNLNTRYANHSDFSKGAGPPFCNQGISSKFDAFDGINVISPLGIRPIPDLVIPSPEQISSVTACSDGDLHSDGEPFDTEGTFPCTTLIRVLQSSSDNYVTMQNIDQGELNSIDSGGLLDNNQNLHHVPFPSQLVENEELPYSSACILEKVSEIVPDGSNVLSSTVVNKSRSNHEELLEYPLQAMGGQQFYQWPVRELYSTETVQSRSRNSKCHPLSDLYGWDCSGTSSSAAELTQPPSKRTRIEDFSFSKNGPFNQVISSEDQVLRSEESSHSGRWSDGPLCNKDNAEDTGKKHLSSVGNPVKTLVTSNQKSDITGVQSGNGPVLSEELNSGCKSFGINNANACKITSNGTNYSQGLVQGIMPLPEQPNLIQEKEVTFVTKPDQPQSKGEEDSIENAADHQSGTNSEGPKVLGVSLTDYFTAKQIKEHLCSLNPLLGQCIMRGKANTAKYSVGDNVCQLCSVDKFAFSPAQISCFILIGYLDYCKTRGFATCYIWACPPQKGEDYILYCHPETQKTPKPEKLRQWYRSMLGKAIKDHIVLDYTNLYDNFFIPSGDCKTKVTAARLPYFDGDYWSEAAENIIRTVENQSGGESEMKVKRLLTKRTLKAMGHNDLTADATKDILVMQKLGQAILPCKEDFIIAHLHSTCMNCHEVILSGGHYVCSQCENFRLCSRCVNLEQNLNVRKTHMAYGGEHQLSQIMVKEMPADTAEEDVILDNDIFQNRHSFLSFCQGNHHQFDTLRRAKHSSMMILYHVHKQAPVSTGTICSICLKDVLEEAGWHCEICPKFNVCSACYNRNGEGSHDHKLIQQLIKAACGVNSKQAQQQKTNKDPFDVLIHASKCFATKENPCSYRFCVKIITQLNALYVCLGAAKFVAEYGCSYVDTQVHAKIPLAECHIAWILRSMLKRFQGSLISAEGCSQRIKHCLRLLRTTDCAIV